MQCKAKLKSRHEEVTYCSHWFHFLRHPFTRDGMMLPDDHVWSGGICKLWCSPHLQLSFLCTTAPKRLLRHMFCWAKHEHTLVHMFPCGCDFETLRTQSPEGTFWAGLSRERDSYERLVSPLFPLPLLISTPSVTISKSCPQKPFVGLWKQIWGWARINSRADEILKKINELLYVKAWPINSKQEKDWECPREGAVQGKGASVFCEPSAALLLCSPRYFEDTVEGPASEGSCLQIDFLASIATWHSKVWLHSISKLKIYSEMRKTTTPSNELIIAANELQELLCS